MNGSDHNLIFQGTGEERVVFNGAPHPGFFNFFPHPLPSDSENVKSSSILITMVPNLPLSGFKSIIHRLNHPDSYSTSLVFLIITYIDQKI